MKRRTRLIILLTCAVLFLVIAPYIVLYSLGYRVDFLHHKVTATGGIYVRVFPTGADVSIDHAAADTTSYFYNSVFVQNLLPGQHHVTITKDAYYDYNKNLDVTENEVTKLENVTLFRKDITFHPILDIPATDTTPAVTAKTQFDLLTKKPIITPPVIKNMVTFMVNGDTTTYLATDGLLYTYNPTDKTSQAITTEKITIDKKTTYVLRNESGSTFLQAGKTLLRLSPDTKTFESFAENVTDFDGSPDGQKVAYWNSSELWYWMPKATTETKKILLQKSAGITNVFWLNNDYIIFSTGNQLVITEIDVRGNTNIVSLNQKSDQLFFNSQDKKAYLLSGKEYSVSDRLLP